MSSIAPAARPPAAPVSLVLLAVNVLVFVLQGMDEDAAIRVFALWPLGAGFAPWQLVTSAFLHASLLHLMANMLGVWMFGRDVEIVLGTRRYAMLYGASLATASLCQLVVTSSLPEAVPTVGASGALFGVLLAFALIFPRRIVVPLIPPIPMQARWFVLLYAAFELYAGVTGTLAGVAHFAHLGGLIGGFVCMAAWKRRA